MEKENGVVLLVACVAIIAIIAMAVVMSPNTATPKAPQPQNVVGAACAFASDTQTTDGGLLSTATIDCGQGQDEYIVLTQVD